MKDQVTLRPGDYVSTKGLTEDGYHAVARAFMAAGAESGEYPDRDQMDRAYFGWCDLGELWHSENTVIQNGRHLTPQQVVSATNAGATTPDPLTTILEQAAEHDATAKHHAAMHERLMQQAREMLPEGWRLVHDTETGTDMTDLANWHEGDVVVATLKGLDITDGKMYTLCLDDGDIGFRDDAGDFRQAFHRVKWHHRP